MSEAQGARNVYTCQACAGQIMTVNTDDGTTPFAIACRAQPRCSGTMYSAFYRIDPATTLTPEWEWFRPSDAKAKRLDRKYPGTLDHVQRGGLLLRPSDRQRVDPLGVSA